MSSDGRKVLLVMGSVRAGRVCPKIADWVRETGKRCTDLDYEIVDLADWHLPMDDEPGIPALRACSQPHTRAWSEKIKGAAAVVFVTPQFNWGCPAVLKNAIDHLYREWQEKPVAFVTYGGHGGTRCARDLRRVAVALKMSFVRTSPALWLSEAVIRHNAPLNPEQDFVRHEASVRRALKELEAQISGRESVVSWVHRKTTSLCVRIA